MIFPVVFKLKKNGAWVPPDAGTFAVDCSLSAPWCSTGRGLEDDPQKQMFSLEKSRGFSIAKFEYR